MILMGYLNAYLGDSCCEREEDLMTALVDRVLVNMIYHFMPQRQYRGVCRWIWIMQW